MKKIVMAMVLVLVMSFVFLAFAMDELVVFRNYVVKEGDSLSEIAWALKVSRADLINWNPELGMRNIKPDDKIRYLLPYDGRKKIAQIREKAIERVAENVSGLEDEIQKLITQMAEFPDKIDSQKPTEQENGTELFVIWLVVVVIILLVCWFGIFFRLKARKKNQLTKSQEKPKAKEKNLALKLEIHGLLYIYRPKIDSEGKFISLHKNRAGNTLCFSNPNDLRKSLRSSFNQHPILMKQEIKAGRLTLTKN